MSACSECQYDLQVPNSRLDGTTFLGRALEGKFDDVSQCWAENQHGLGASASRAKRDQPVIVGKYVVVW